MCENLSLRNIRGPFFFDFLTATVKKKNKKKRENRKRPMQNETMKEERKKWKQKGLNVVVVVFN